VKVVGINVLTVYYICISFWIMQQCGKISIIEASRKAHSSEFMMHDMMTNKDTCMEGVWLINGVLEWEVGGQLKVVKRTTLFRPALSSDTYQ
jgi:hypothetical protein